MYNSISNKRTQHTSYGAPDKDAKRQRSTQCTGIYDLSQICNAFQMVLITFRPVLCARQLFDVAIFLGRPLQWSPCRPMTKRRQFAPRQTQNCWSRMKRIVVLLVLAALIVASMAHSGIDYMHCFVTVNMTEMWFALPKNSSVENCMEPKKSFRAFFVPCCTNWTAMAKQKAAKSDQRQCERNDVSSRRKMAEIKRCTHENKEISKTTHK